jgi:hypothetical protein
MSAKACWLVVGGLGSLALPAMSQVTTQERSDLVVMHNTVREDAAPVPIPLLQAILWSGTLETSAQTYTNGCIYQHSPGALGGLYGENLYASTSTEIPVPRPTPAAVVSSWAAETAQYNYSANTCSGVCGHYTQIVGRTATQVGCGVALCSPATTPFTSPPFNTTNWYLYVCQYQTGQSGGRPYLCDYDRNGSFEAVCDTRGVFVDGLETTDMSRWQSHT